ncbi:transposase [Streptomyces sp. H34-S5]|nr:transposase [Streptomyces sp. H34-S5]MCY0940781.1 transposase [Streptomyces sp. H34-AA3]MCZ4082981.1 transposase [Streptomyces sp. H34-S5]
MASCPLAWRLFLPASWDGPDAAARREACRIPAEEQHQPKWRLAVTWSGCLNPRVRWSPTSCSSTSPSVASRRAGSPSG